MKLVQFVAKNLHGFLNINIQFNKDLTFLTGINGSGKTTVVRAISSLISPSLIALAHIVHDKMELLLEHEGKEITINSMRDDKYVYITSSHTDSQLKVPIIIPDEELIEYETMKSLVKYYRRLELDNAENQIIQLIKSLPTPMFLGIDRKSKELFQDERFYRGYVTAVVSERRDNIFKNSLSDSLEEAIVLVSDVYKDLNYKKDMLAYTLRRQIIENFFEYRDFDPYELDFKILDLNISREEEMKDAARSILSEIGLEKEFIDKQLNTFYDKLKSLKNTIPNDFDFQKSKPEDNPEIMKALVEFMINRPQLDRINLILNLIDNHIKEIQKISEPIINYLDAINSFLKDSNKHLDFDKGNLLVKVKENMQVPVHSLSSGECQLFVILTHLAFNPDAKHANVFIIDEPELSLHVKWQEEFVTAIQKANPDIQLILATHSPSIVLDRVEHCVDLSENVR